jgi:hypothetical protein
MELRPQTYPKSTPAGALNCALCLRRVARLTKQSIVQVSGVRFDRQQPGPHATN